MVGLRNYGVELVKVQVSTVDTSESRLNHQAKGSEVLK
jgi:hypothetical protein